MLFLKIIGDGGPVMWLILFCSIVAMFIFLEKWFHFHREQINVGELVHGLINVLKRDGMIEATSLCDNTPGPVARILMAAILAYGKKDKDIKEAVEDAIKTEKGDVYIDSEDLEEKVKEIVHAIKHGGFNETTKVFKSVDLLTESITDYEHKEEDIRQAIEDAALVEMPRLERRLNVLATIAYIAPLLGLLGTVLGMISAFEVIGSEAGITLTAQTLSKPIREALVTTAAGLCVAIPAYVAYNYLVSRVESFALEMEKAASEILYFFKHYK